MIREINRIASFICLSIQGRFWSNVMSNICDGYNKMPAIRGIDIVARLCPDGIVEIADVGLWTEGGTTSGTIGASVFGLPD